MRRLIVAFMIVSILTSCGMDSKKSTSNSTSNATFTANTICPNLNGFYHSQDYEFLKSMVIKKLDNGSYYMNDGEVDVTIDGNIH